MGMVVWARLYSGTEINNITVLMRAGIVVWATPNVEFADSFLQLFILFTQHLGDLKQINTEAVHPV